MKDLLVILAAAASLGLPFWTCSQRSGVVDAGARALPGGEQLAQLFYRTITAAREHASLPPVGRDPELLKRFGTAVTLGPDGTIWSAILLAR